MSALTQVGGNAIYDAATPTPPDAVPAIIAASGSYVTGIMPAAGYSALTAAVNLSQGGTISIQRYLDSAGAFPVGAVPSTTFSGGSVAWVGVNDGLGFAFWQVTVTNTSGSTGTVTSFKMLQCSRG